MRSCSLCGPVSGSDRIQAFSWGQFPASARLQDRAQHCSNPSQAPWHLPNGRAGAVPTPLSPVLNPWLGWGRGEPPCPGERSVPSSPGPRSGLSILPKTQGLLHGRTTNKSFSAVSTELGSGGRKAKMEQETRVCIFLSVLWKELTAVSEFPFAISGWCQLIAHLPRERPAGEGDTRPLLPGLSRTALICSPGPA